jgi:hypothetical protein
VHLSWKEYICCPLYLTLWEGRGGDFLPPTRWYMDPSSKRMIDGDGWWSNHFNPFEGLMFQYYSVQYSMYDDATLTTQMWLGHCCSCHPTPRFAQRLIRRKIDWYHCRVIEFWCGGACNVDCVLCSSSMGSFLLGRGGFNLCVISLHLSCPRRRYRLLLPGAWFWTRNVRHTIAGPTKATLIPVNIMSEFVRLEVRGGCWLLSCSKMSGGPFWLFDQYNTRRPRVNLCPWCILYHSGTTMLLYGSSFQ